MFLCQSASSGLVWFRGAFVFQILLFLCEDGILVNSLGGPGTRHVELELTEIHLSLPIFIYFFSVCVCIYVCVCVGLCVCMGACASVSARICMHICVRMPVKAKRGF